MHFGLSNFDSFLPHTFARVCDIFSLDVIRKNNWHTYKWCKCKGKKTCQYLNLKKTCQYLNLNLRDLTQLEESNFTQ